MKVLLVGGGGREHALGWKIAQSLQLSKLYLIPGNPGLRQLADISIETLDIVETDIMAIADGASEKSVDLVVIGPEAPLAAGLADILAEKSIPCFGPTQDAAMLESSKCFMKDLCKAASIPTAHYGKFTDSDAAKRALDNFTAPFVIKADGLAAGKGVIIAQTRNEAEDAIDSMMAGAFGNAGEEIVIEEFMEGEEASFFVITDGKTTLPMIASQDHKRVGEGDVGPNTGGMGAYSPTPVFTPDIQAQVMTQIIEPTIAQMNSRGTPFKGVLFAGLMITADGPKLIEYNARFGDPECQVMMRRMTSDFLPVLHAAATDSLDGHTLSWSDDPCALIVMAANGYPGAYQKGSTINNLDAAASLGAVEIFHAGTKTEGDKLLSNGGRVLNITATANSVTGALDRAYEAVDLVHWPEGFCRRDIGWRARKYDNSHDK